MSATTECKHINKREFPERAGHGCTLRNFECLDCGSVYDDYLSRWAVPEIITTVIQRERERCARIAESAEKELGIGDYVGFCDAIAAKIREGNPT